MEHEEDADRYGGPEYRRPAMIGQSELREGLLSLALFGSALANVDLRSV